MTFRTIGTSIVQQILYTYRYFCTFFDKFSFLFVRKQDASSIPVTREWRPAGYATRAQMGIVGSFNQSLPARWHRPWHVRTFIESSFIGGPKNILKSGYINLTFGALVFMMVAFSCDDSLTVSQDIDPENLSKDSDLAYNVTMEYTDDGQKLMELEAPVLMRKNTVPIKDIFPEGILVTFYENQEPYATLTSKYAERLPDDYLVIASDEVVFENIKGEKLETSELRWDERKGKIFTDRFARLTRPNEIIYGYGFTANQDFTDIEFEKTTGKRPLPQLEGL